MPESLTFVGRIAGLGTTSGIRLVVGSWHESPLGAFGDVMVQQPDGHRILLAPNDAAAAFIESAYNFDEVVIGSVQASTDGAQQSITAPGLTSASTWAHDRRSGGCCGCCRAGWLSGRSGTGPSTRSPRFWSEASRPPAQLKRVAGSSMVPSTCRPSLRRRARGEVSASARWPR